MENESVLGQVQRQASTSSSSSNNNDAPSASAAPSQERRAHEGSPKRNKRRKVETFTDPQDRYAHRLAVYSSEFYDHLHGHDDHWLRGASSDDRIASNDWSNEDLSCFFVSLARRSRFRPDLITQDLAGRKTKVQVSAYLHQLRGIAAKYTLPPVAEGTAPAARQVSDRWLQREEVLVKGNLKVRVDADVTEDSKIPNAMLFLQAQCKKLKRAGEHYRVQLTNGNDSTLQVTSFSLGELQRLMCSKGRDSTKEYQAFDQIHPLPQIAREGKVNRTGRPTTIKKTIKKDRHPSQTPDESQEQQALITSSALRTRRLLLRAIELDLLLIAQHNEQTDSHNIPVITGQRCPIKFKNRLVKAATLSDSVPRKLIDQIQVVFAPDVEEAAESSVQLRKALRLLQTASDDALARLLSSLTHEELFWIDSLFGEHHDDNPGHAGSGTSASPPRGRDVESQEFHGYSLAGLNKDEKRKFKARIRAREAKYGVEATREMEVAPHTKRSQGLGNEKKDVWNKGKSKILEPFQSLLEGLSGKERKRKENRLRAKVRALGLQKVIQIELEDEQHRSSANADSQMSPDGVTGDVQHDDATATDRTSAVADSVDVQQASSSVGPSHPPKAHRGDNSRFTAIGHDAASVRAYLKEHCESVGLFNLKTLGGFLSASTMTSCTRPDQVDSLVDQEEPLRLDLLATLPRLRDELRDFVATVVSDVVQNLKLGAESSAEGIEQAHIEKVLGQGNNGDDGTAERDGASHIPSMQFLGLSRNDEEGDDDDWEMSDEADLEVQTSGSDDGEADGIDDDEIFESHMEAAQVDAVRRIWGGLPCKFKSEDETQSLTSGFYWPTVSSRGASRNDLDKDMDMDTISDAEDQELPLSSDGEEEDSEAESILRWDAIDEGDRERDERYERQAWPKWFGGSPDDLETMEDAPQEDGENVVHADDAANASGERDEEPMQGSDDDASQSSSEEEGEEDGDDAAAFAEGE